MRTTALLVLGLLAGTAHADDGWPIEIIKRPPTLRQGMLRLQGDLGIRFVDRGPNDDDTVIDLAFGIGYGVSDKLELGAGYGFQTEDVGDGGLLLYAEYKFLDGRVDVAGTGGLVYSLGSENGALLLGAEVQFEITEKFAIYTPGYQLAIGILNDGPTPIALAVPVGIRYQFTSQIFGYLQTTLLTIGVKDSGDSSIADELNVLVGAFYSLSNKIDLGAALSIPNGDDFGILLTARFFL